MSIWTDKFKESIKRIDKELESLPSVEEEPRKIQYYNIHKRTLPIGVDMPVMFRLTLEEAKQALDVYKPKTVTHEDTTILVFYDMVKSDALPVEQSVFYNEGPIMREDI